MHEVYAVVTLMGPKYDLQRITVNDLIQEQEKDSYCRQASYPGIFPVSGYDYDRRVFWRLSRSQMVQFKNAFVRHYEHLSYTTLTIYFCQEIWVKYLYTTLRENNITGSKTANDVYTIMKHCCE